MQNRRGLLAALAAGLVGCVGRRRPQTPPANPSPPMDYEPITPQTPTPRQSPLSVDRAFRWPAPYVDAANSASPPTAGPSESPSVQWEVWLPEDDETTHARIDGRWLYVFDGRRMAAIDRRQGWHAWSGSLASDLRSAPTLVDPGFVAGALTSERNAGLARFGVEGSLDWRRPTTTVGLPPTVADETVFHCAGEEFVARSLTNGTEQWRTPTDGDERFVTTPAVVDGTVYVHGSRRMYALDAESGDVLWRRSPDTDGSPTTAVSVGGGRAFVGFEDGPAAVAYDVESGEPVWDAAGDIPVGVYAIGTERVVAGTRSGRVVARSVATGEVDWAVPGAAGPAIVADDSVFVRGVGSETGQVGLVALDGADGSRRWHRPVQAEGWLLVADGHCYLNRGSGVVQCLG